MQMIPEEPYDFPLTDAQLTELLFTTLANQAAEGIALSEEEVATVRANLREQHGVVSR